MDFQDVIVLSPIGMTKTFDLSDPKVLDGHYSVGKNERLCWASENFSQSFFSAGQEEVKKFSLSNEGVVSVPFPINPADTSESVGLSVDNELLVCGRSSGSVYLFETDDLAPKKSFSVGANLSFCKSHRSVLISGGKDCAFSVWDLQNQEAIFMAKNVRADTLDLKVPIWLSDASFVEGHEHIFVTASKYGEFSVYDIRGGQRRPVSRSAWRVSRKQGKQFIGTGETPAMLRDLAVTRPVTRVVAYSGSGGGIRAVAGNAIGDICLLDFRLPTSAISSMSSNESTVDQRSKKNARSIGSLTAAAPLNVQTFIPATGSISGLVCGGAGCANLPHMTSSALLDNQPVVLSSSIDRFFRIYDRNSGELLSKIFVKIPISTFLVIDSAEYSTDPIKNRFGKQSSRNSVDIEEASKETDEIWDKMRPVVLKTIKLKEAVTDLPTVTPSKRKKIIA